MLSVPLRKIPRNGKTKFFLINLSSVIALLISKILSHIKIVENTQM